MASTSAIIEKISDFLQTRDKQTNFGECRRCKFEPEFESLRHFLAILFLGDKKVYWSTSKVASHIRSGHCNGATEDEIQQFKREFVYDSPKNLVHKSAVTKKFKESFEFEEYCVIKSPKLYERKSPRQQQSRNAKRAKIEFVGQDDSGDFNGELDDCDELLYEELPCEAEAKDEEDKLEMTFLRDTEEDDSMKMTKTQGAQSSSSTSGLSREEKFIQAVYPQFKGKTKLQLIEDIHDLKRRNDLLEIKAKTYENTINRLLN